MKRLILVTLFVFVAASSASAGPRTLRWSRLAVTAHLDADGRLHVQERQSIVFDGDWNGGERTFRTSLENVLSLDRLSRIDASGSAIPLHEDKSLAHVDDYAWAGSNTLRWRSRLPSDPPFQNREITYVLERVRRGRGRKFWRRWRRGVVSGRERRRCATRPGALLCRRLAGGRPGRMPNVVTL